MPAPKYWVFWLTAPWYSTKTSPGHCYLGIPVRRHSASPHPHHWLQTYQARSVWFLGQNTECLLTASRLRTRTRGCPLLPSQPLLRSPSTTSALLIPAFAPEILSPAQAERKLSSCSSVSILPPTVLPPTVPPQLPRLPSTINLEPSPKYSCPVFAQLWGYWHKPCLS